VNGLYEIEPAVVSRLKQILESKKDEWQQRIASEKSWGRFVSAQVYRNARRAAPVIVSHRGTVKYRQTN
jgi:hypothetical protein